MSLRMSERKQSQAHFTFSLVMEVRRGAQAPTKAGCARNLCHALIQEFHAKVWHQRKLYADIWIDLERLLQGAHMGV